MKGGTFAKGLCWTATAVFLAGSIGFFVEHRIRCGDFHSWLTAEPIRLSVDLSKTNPRSAGFTQTRGGSRCRWRKRAFARSAGLQPAAAWAGVGPDEFVARGAFAAAAGCKPALRANNLGMRPQTCTSAHSQTLRLETGRTSTHEEDAVACVAALKGRLRIEGLGREDLSKMDFKDDTDEADVHH